MTFLEAVLLEGGIGFFGRFGGFEILVMDNDDVVIGGGALGFRGVQGGDEEVADEPEEDEQQADDGDGRPDEHDEG